MPSILDLVSEYYSLEQRKSEEGALDESGEQRYQCLKFFLEFDLTPPLPYEGIFASGMQAKAGGRIEPESDEISRTIDMLFFSKPADDVQMFEEQPMMLSSDMESGLQESGGSPADVQATDFLGGNGADLHKAFMAGMAEAPRQAQEMPVIGAAIVEKPCRVALHFSDGDVKRGIVRELRSGAGSLTLFSQDEKTSEQIEFKVLKAMFVIASPGAAQTADHEGKLVEVLFSDGRILRGYSPDVESGQDLFTLIPEPRQGNIEKVVVFREAIDGIR